MREERGRTVETGVEARAGKFPGPSLIPALNAIQAHSAGGQDAFITKLSATGGTLIYSTYLGGSGTDAGNCIRLDANDNAYVGGSTTSANFRTTAGAFSRTRKGASDGWVAKIAP